MQWFTLQWVLSHWDTQADGCWARHTLLCMHWSAAPTRMWCYQLAASSATTDGICLQDGLLRVYFLSHGLSKKCTACGCNGLVHCVLLFCSVLGSPFTSLAFRPCPTKAFKGSETTDIVRLDC
eukprot:GHUV01026729.1.p3 GENE.GHUV01026729.1~~GHUV01026729.1.p3  ORF type:complete len:123 (-),score=11.92 GHUV01026729.1:243-611(-)